MAAHARDGRELEVRPWQHGAEYDTYRCWAILTGGREERQCMRVVTRDDWTPGLRWYLCEQHARQAERNGFRIVRMTRDILRSVLAAAEADRDWG
jgi:hypothetical protein